MKFCSKCQSTKALTEFHKNSKNSTTVRSNCKSCAAKYNKAYRTVEKDRLKQVRRGWLKANPDYMPNYHKEYANKNREHINEYYRTKVETDLNFAIAKNLRSRLRSALKTNAKVGSAVDDLGCSIEAFKLYIESLFEPDMSWDNYGKGKYKWSYDHIIPLTYFDLQNLAEVKKACHYTNIQPMWYCENSSKKRRLDYNSSTSLRQAS